MGSYNHMLVLVTAILAAGHYANPERHNPLMNDLEEYVQDAERLLAACGFEERVSK